MGVPHVLDTVANWNETVESVVKTKFLWGQGGPNAPHVWCFLRRERLPSDLRCVVDDIVSGRAPGDVFMLTKHWMHSDEWSQATFVCGGNAKLAAAHAAPKPESRYKGAKGVTGGYDGRCFLWNLAKPGNIIRNLTGHSAYVRSIDVSRDGNAALSASDDGTVRLWDLITGNCSMCMVGHESAWVCGFLHCTSRNGVVEHIPA